MPHFRPASTRPADSAPALSAEELRSPEEVAEREQRRRWLIALGAAAMLAVGAWVGVRPALHTIKAWQARRAAAEAEHLIGEHQWLPARGKVEDALALWRQEPAALRAAAIFLAATGNFREAAGFWKQLAATRPLTGDEQRDYATSLLAGADPRAAETHLHEAWPPGQPGGPADWELGMKLAIRRDHASQASELARRLLASHAATPRERLDAALVLLSAGGADAQGAAWDEVRALAQDHATAESLDALVLLAKRAAAPPAGARSPAGPAPEGCPELSELIERIDAHPLARIQHRLLATDLRLAQDPTRRAELIQSAMDRFAASRDDADLATLGAWLYVKGEYARVLEAIPAARSTGDRALFFQRLDALGALGRWNDIREAIESGKLELDPMVAQMYLARCADKLNDPQTRDARWNAAFDAAGGKPEKLVQLGQYAGKNGAAGVAEKSFRAALQAAPASREAYASLLNLLEARGETRQLRDTLATMLAIWPRDAAVRNDAAYFDALLDEKVPAALATARDLVRADPASLPHRVTLALSELRSSDDQGAMDAFRGIDPALAAMEPRQRAVYAATLWATSYNQQARETLGAIRLEDLLPEERLLVKPIQDRTPSVP
jgi:hypothetical protein